MFKQDNRDTTAKQRAGNMFTSFVKDILSNALAAVILYILGGLIVAIGLAIYFGVSFFTALGGSVIVLGVVWALNYFSDHF